MATSSQYKITIQNSTDVRLAFLALVNGFLNFLSLRKSRQFWGVVYDSVNKQPLDPVIVKLMYADGGEAESGLTDLHGHYGFLARPGKFKIFARKTNYTFPSVKAAGERDGIYDNLYHGEFFSLSEDSEVLAPNIPMDPVSQDWNQDAKNQLGMATSPYGALLAKSLATVFFWLGFLYCALNAWNFFPDFPTWLAWLLGVYALIIILAIFLPEPRLWGQIILSAGMDEILDLNLELGNPKLPGIVLGRAVIHPNGRFLLRASQGSYLLSVHSTDKQGQKSLLASLPIKAGKLGVFNSTLVVEKVI